MGSTLALAALTLEMVSLITGIIGIATAIAIVTLIRKDHLRVRYGLWWITLLESDLCEMQDKSSE